MCFAIHVARMACHLHACRLHLFPPHRLFQRFTLDAHITSVHPHVAILYYSNIQFASTYARGDVFAQTGCT